MDQETANSHYISKWLTRRWEIPGSKKNLWYYDFKRDAFDIQSAKTLFTLDTPHPGKVEAFLNTYLESPLSQYVSDLIRRGERDRTWKQERALRLTLLFQGQRALDPHTDGKFSLENLADKDEAYLDQLAVAAETLGRFFAFVLPCGEFLYYPSTGLVPFPVATAGPLGLFLPVAPTVLVAWTPPGVTDTEVNSAAARRGLLTGLSVGSERASKIVIPGGIHGNVDPTILREQIRSFRANTTQLCRLVQDVDGEYPPGLRLPF
jgi:hypothetical protein